MLGCLATLAKSHRKLKDTAFMTSYRSWSPFWKLSSRWVNDFGIKPQKTYKHRSGKKGYWTIRVFCFVWFTKTLISQTSTQLYGYVKSCSIKRKMQEPKTNIMLKGIKVAKSSGIVRGCRNIAEEVVTKSTAVLGSKKIKVKVSNIGFKLRVTLES